MRKPQWLIRMEDALEYDKNLLQNLIARKEMFNYLIKYFETEQYQNERQEVKNAALDFYNRNNLVDFDKEIEKWRKKVEKLELSHKKALVSWKKWMISKDFE